MNKSKIQIGGYAKPVNNKFVNWIVRFVFGVPPFKVRNMQQRTLTLQGINPRIRVFKAPKQLFIPSSPPG